MRRFALIAAVTLPLLMLGACADAPTDFPIAAHPLEAGELSATGFAPVAFPARVFDVVNQDMSSETSTGIAGKVVPTPIDVLSQYAAHKFRATGGIASTRFVIKKASVMVTPVTTDGDGFFQEKYKAEMTVDMTAMLVASKPNGDNASITATSTQSQRVGLNTSPDERRSIYLDLLNRALQGVDSELTRQLPMQFGDMYGR